MEGKLFARTGEPKPWYRGTQTPVQGRTPAPAGEDAAAYRGESACRHLTFVSTLTGFACTGLFSSSPLLSATCSDLVTTAMPGMPTA